MASKLKIAEVRGRELKSEFVNDGTIQTELIDEDSWGVNKDIQDLVEPVKFVLSPFIRSTGKADMNAEITFSNKSDRPVKIDQVEVQIRNDQEANLSPAKSNYAEKEYLPWEDKNQSNWTSIYKNNSDVSDEKLLSQKGISEEDGTFSYTIGPEENGHRVMTTPVHFERPPQPEVDEGFRIYRLSNFRTLTGKEVVLLPENPTDEFLSDQFDDGYTKVDGINFWFEWEDSELTTHKNDAEFALGFDFESEVGDVSHCYFYYNLPESGILGNSQSDPEVTDFPQSDQRHVFKHWKEKYGIRPKQEEDDFTLAEPHRVTRADIKDADNVTTTAHYEVPRVASVDRGLNWVVQSVLLIIATGTIGIFGTNLTVPRLLIIVGVVIAVVGGGYLILLQNFNPLTTLYFRLFE